MPDADWEGGGESGQAYPDGYGRGVHRGRARHGRHSYPANQVRHPENFTREIEGQLAEPLAPPGTHKEPGW